jgi:hypothetical protein
MASQAHYFNDRFNDPRDQHLRSGHRAQRQVGNPDQKAFFDETKAIENPVQSAADGLSHVTCGAFFELTKFDGQKIRIFDGKVEPVAS